MEISLKTWSNENLWQQVITENRNHKQQVMRTNSYRATNPNFQSDEWKFDGSLALDPSTFPFPGVSDRIANNDRSPQKTRKNDFSLTM